MSCYISSTKPREVLHGYTLRPLLVRLLFGFCSNSFKTSANCRYEKDLGKGDGSWLANHAEAMFKNAPIMYTKPLLTYILLIHFISRKLIYFILREYPPLFRCSDDYDYSPPVGQSISPVRYSGDVAIFPQW